MALADNALTTLSVVKNELGITNSNSDSYLERQINTYSDIFRTATGRPWHRDDAYTEKVTSTGDTRLHLERRPVRSVSEVKVKGDTVDADGYEIEDDEKGYLRRIDERWEHTAAGRRRVEGYATHHELRVEVTYDGGYVTPKQVDDGAFSDRDLPHDIEQAVIDSVINAYARKGQPKNVSSESIDTASVDYHIPDTADAKVQGISASQSFQGAVERYKDRSVL
jgi:hypothetical protein